MDGYTDHDEMTDKQSDPLDAGSVPSDNDGDKVSDINDADDDNDAVLDSSDAFPFDPTEFDDTDGQSDPLNANSTPPDNDSDFVSDRNDDDDDNDGMPGAWESLYEGLNQMVNDPDKDRDGDGQNNHAEYVAGTNPVDPLSVFRAELAIVQPGSFTLKWNSVPGRIYRVWRSYELVSWTLVSEETGEDSKNGVTEWTSSLDPEEKQGYYRVQVLP